MVIVSSKWSIDCLLVSGDSLPGRVGALMGGVRTSLSHCTLLAGGSCCGAVSAVLPSGLGRVPSGLRPGCPGQADSMMAGSEFLHVCTSAAVCCLHRRAHWHVHTSAPTMRTAAIIESMPVSMGCMVLVVIGMFSSHDNPTFLRTSHTIVRLVVSLSEVVGSDPRGRLCDLACGVKSSTVQN